MAGTAFQLPWAKTALAVVSRPDLWSTAIRALRSHAPSQWWRSSPRLPIPDQEWMQFRLTTAYGSPPADTAVPGSDVLDAAEVIEWLEWLRAWNSNGDGLS